MRHLIAVLVALCVGCMWSGAPPRAFSRPSADTTADTTADMNVPLTAVVDTASAVWRGISNIFLDTLTGPIRDSVRMPETWTDAALDNVLGGADLQPIRILRFRTAGDTALQFAIDTAGDLDSHGATAATLCRCGLSAAVIPSTQPMPARCFSLT